MRNNGRHLLTPTNQPINQSTNQPTANPQTQTRTELTKPERHHPPTILRASTPPFCDRDFCSGWVLEKKNRSPLWLALPSDECVSFLFVSFFGPFSFSFCFCFCLFVGSACPSLAADGPLVHRPFFFDSPRNE